MAVKYVFVLGGVVSGLGKGITAASLGRLLKARGYAVTMQKFDPYINVDPGTMNPIQHGEVFVTDDGAETDLDLGHYERFIDERLTRVSNVTSGRVYRTVLERHRHRYEVNNDYRTALMDAGMRLCGMSPDGRIVEMLELPDHPYFLATQAHPEFNSRPNHPHPLFLGLISSAVLYRSEEL